MKKILFLLIFVITFGVGAITCEAKASSEHINLGTPKNVIARKNNINSLKIQWKKVKKADGYIVYRYNKKLKKYKAVKNIKEQKNTQYIDNKLKINKIYRYRVAAYKIVKGKKQIGEKSDWVSAKTYKKSTKYINAGRISGKTELTLGIAGSGKVKQYVEASKYGTHVMSYPISTKLRWRSSNRTIATVDNKGKAKAGVTAGTCYIYAKAHNGNEKKIKVEVKDFTHPKEFSLYDGKNLIINEMLVNYKDEICDITHYLVCNNNGKKIDIYQNAEQSYFVTPGTIDTKPIDKQLRKLLFNFPTRISIRFERDYVEFYVGYYDGTGNYDALLYMINNDGLNKELIETAAESHWQAISFRPAY